MDLLKKLADLFIAFYEKLVEAKIKDKIRLEEEERLRKEDEFIHDLVEKLKTMDEFSVDDANDELLKRVQRKSSSKRGSPSS